MGGLKLNDTIDFNRKVGYYGKISSTFMKSTSEGSGEYYFPNGDNDTAGKKQHKDLKNKYSTNPYGKWPTFESFRDYCFEEAKKDNKSDNCHANGGGCLDCIRLKELDNLK